MAFGFNPIASNQPIATVVAPAEPVVVPVKSVSAKHKIMRIQNYVRPAKLRIGKVTVTIK